MKWKLARKKIEEKVIDPFRPENIIQALKNPDEVLMKSLRSLTEMTGSITGINFKSYSKIFDSPASTNSDFGSGASDIPETACPCKFNNKESHEPLNPVCPVIR
jgi:hypothetical protein